MVTIRKFQKDILEGKDVNHLLNEAYAISIRIKNKKMEEWCHYELSGYPDGNSVPEYRKIFVRFVADGTFRTNIPVEIPDGFQFLNYHLVTNPISSLLKLTQGDDNNNKVVSFEFTTQLNSELCKMYGQPLDWVFKQQASISQLTDIESKVREKVINWGLHLNPESEKYIDDSEENTQTINNYNVLGNISNSQIQQGNTNSKQKKSFIKDFIGNLFGSLFEHLFKW